MTTGPITMDLGAPTHLPPGKTGTDALGYPPRAGLAALRAAFERRIRERLATTAGELAVTVTAGASMAFTSVIAALCEPGDRVLIPDPGFPAYRSVVSALGRVPEHYPLTGAVRDGADLASRMPGAALVVLNSPSNPTGQTLSRPALTRIAAAAREHDVLIVSDEVYADLVEREFASAATEAPERTLVLDSVSKTFALAGTRVGCVAGPAELVGRVTRTHWFLGMGVAVPSQELALAALSADADYQQGVRAQLARKREVCLRVLGEHGVEATAPAAGLFVWLDVSDLGAGTTVGEALRRTVGVTVSPGEAFGPSGAGHIRISFAGDEDDVARGADRIGRALSALRRRVEARKEATP